MRDDAPRSTALVRGRLACALAGEFDVALDAMVAATRVDTRDRAVTTVTRPCRSWPPSRADEFDRLVIAALTRLPGAAHGVAISMGRTYEITWAGVRVPA